MISKSEDEDIIVPWVQEGVQKSSVLYLRIEQAYNLKELSNKTPTDDRLEQAL